jgi:hypothetical protein
VDGCEAGFDDAVPDGVKVFWLLLELMGVMKSPSSLLLSKVTYNSTTLTNRTPKTLFINIPTAQI